MQLSSGGGHNVAAMPGQSHGIKRLVTQNWSLTVPHGPATFPELFQWPARAAASFHQKEEICGCCDIREGVSAWELRRATFQRNFIDHGIQLITAYSGMDCAAQAACAILGSITALNPSAKPIPLRLHSACDNDRVCQKVLLASTPRCEHVFSDLQSFLSPPLLERLKQAVPQPGKSMEETTARYQEAVMPLLPCKGEGMAATAPCLVHGRHCTPYPEMAESGRRITMMVAGSTCVAWSRLEAYAQALAIQILAWAVDQCSSCAFRDAHCWTAQRRGRRQGLAHDTSAVAFGCWLMKLKAAANSCGFFTLLMRTGTSHT